MIHMMQNITNYARLWRNISREIRTYMHMDSTQLALNWLGQVSTFAEFFNTLKKIKLPLSMTPWVQYYTKKSQLAS